MGGVVKVEAIGRNRWARLAKRIPGLTGSYRSYAWMGPVYTEVRPLILACEQEIAHQQGKEVPPDPLAVLLSAVEHAEPKTDVEMLPQLRVLMHELRDTVEKASEARRSCKTGHLWIDLGVLNNLGLRIQRALDLLVPDMQQVRGGTT